MEEVRCSACPLRALPLFFGSSAPDVQLVQSLKRREIHLRAGETLIHEGEVDTLLYTLYSGWAYRFRTLSDGRRQILSILLAGSFIGVQQRMLDVAGYGVVTLTDATFCVFDKNSLWEMHRQSPSMGFEITWLTAVEESLIDDNLLSVGRRSAEERLATLLILVFKRAAALQADGSAAGVPFPLTQQHLADGLGLSLVHTHKTLRRLEARGLHRIDNGRLYIGDIKALGRFAELYADASSKPRPLV